MINFDAFSSGQIESKLWLCRELEKIWTRDQVPVIWILGAWYGLTAFLLLSRERLKPSCIRAFDLSEENARLANRINDNWVWRDGRFLSFSFDCDFLNYSEPEFFQSPVPDIVINTATEHFHSREWWEQIPPGRLVILQNNDMPLPEHVGGAASLADFAKNFPFREKLFAGQLDFNYGGGGAGFRRFMLMGIK
jgi:hypothetical protein